MKCERGAAASGIVVARIVLTGWSSLAETGRRTACVQFTQQRLHAGSRALRVSWISCSVPRGAACTELRNPSSTPLNVNFFIANNRVAGPLSEGRSRRPRLHHSRPPRTASRFWRKEGRSLPRYTWSLLRRAARGRRRRRHAPATPTIDEN
ncbi:hypothetical protein B5X24_HaOG201765 [Helicoverpa armigera]|nr:hypothetical protein B5X24_HaOG201765 [Helicoverpa armigera]